MPHISLRTTLLLLLFCIGLASQANASVSVFADRPTFAMAAGATTLTDFEQGPVGQPCPVVFLGTDPCRLEVGGVEYVSTEGTGVHPPNLFSPTIEVADFGTSLALSPGAIPMAEGSFFLNLDATALGLDIASGTGGGQQVVFVLTDANQDVWQFSTVASLTGTFFGFVSDVAVSRVSIYDGTGTLCCGKIWLDNVAVASVAEPGGLALVLAALLAAAAPVIRRRRAFAPGAASASSAAR